MEQSINSKAYPSMCRGGLHRGLNALYASDLFTLTPEQLGVLFSNARTNDCPAGTILYTPDDPPERLYIVKRGRITLYELTAGGRRRVIRHFRPPSVFGMIALLAGTTGGSFAEATEDSVVGIVGREEAIALLQHRSDVALRLLQTMSKRLLYYQGLLEDVLLEASYCPVRVRLASFLICNTSPDSPSVDGISHEEIGDNIGAVRQTVTTALNLMRKEGLIQTGQRKILVVDRSGLESIIRNSESQILTG